jgi:DNA (cytosine-5)-methyltransferase 1
VTYTCYDEFSGFGGASQGTTSVPGVELIFAANHKPIAIEVHSLNFPAAEHYLGDVVRAPIETFPRADFFWSSPACPGWTDARGVKREFDKANQVRLLTDEDLGQKPDTSEAARSRALMEEVPRYLRAMNLRGKPVLGGVVENVIQCRKWADWKRWLREIQAEGYRVRVIALNSMHAHGRRTGRVPQSRDRLYVAYWLASLGRDPDWAKWLRPRAYCPTCDRIVSAVQVFKRSGVDMGRYGRHGQYLYRCPSATCRNRPVDPNVVPAAAAIDWSLPAGPTIGERMAGTAGKPLKPATLARVAAGVARYARPILAPAGGTWRDEASPLDQPMPTRTTRDTDAVVVPPLLVPCTGRDGKNATSAEQPLPTQTCRQETGLVTLPFIAELRGGGSKHSARPVTEPLATFSAQGTHHGLVTPPGAPGWLPYVVIRQNTPRGNPAQMSTPVTEPMRTLTAAGHQSLIGWDSDPRWNDLLMSYYSNGSAHRVNDPMGTLTTKDRFALVGQVDAPAVEDCTFRMLTPREIAAGMAFHPNYKVIGTGRDQVAGFGNAVTPPVGEVLFSALVECISGESLEVAA